VSKVATSAVWGMFERRNGQACSFSQLAKVGLFYSLTQDQTPEADKIFFIFDQINL
jgi:hypothetical protein